MTRLWAAVRSNPVRTWAYGVVLPGFGVLLVYGVLSGTQAAAWIALAAGVLAVPGAEAVRSRVTPTPKVPGPQNGTSDGDPLEPRY